MGFRPYRRGARRVNIKLAIAEIEDAIELLEAVELHFDDAVPRLEKARDVLEKALPFANNGRLRRAVAELKQAQQLMVDRS